MAKLYLKFEQAVLKEVALSEGAVTIGRLPDNSVQIDNLAVSGHHCRIYKEHEHYVVEDNNSLNGTYVNNQRVTKAALKDNDEILIGKHIVQFHEGSADGAHVAAASHSVMPGMEKTMMFNPKSKAAHDVGLHDHHAGSAPAPARERTGVLTVIDGKTDEPKYTLTSKLTVIGKSDMASVKLKGWFAPKVAANLMKRESKYIIAAADQHVKIMINGEHVQGQHELMEGDLIDVAGTKFQFSFAE